MIIIYDTPLRKKLYYVTICLKLDCYIGFLIPFHPSFLFFEVFAKKLDPETGLYYFGARYYDPVLSRWISADPALEKYLPDLNNPTHHSKTWPLENKLLGGGGVYNPINLNIFVYSFNCPIILKDPSGRWPTKLIPVHQRTIQRILGGYVDPVYIQKMQEKQLEIDKFQDIALQHMHAMTGMGLDRGYAITEAERFVKDKLQEAMKEKKAGNLNKAYASFAEALHTLQDAASPAHAGFKFWRGDPFKMEKLSANEIRKIISAGYHAIVELYPFGVWKDQLEGVTRWAYDIFIGVTPMPQNFFDPVSGSLLLPSEYKPIYEIDIEKLFEEPFLE